MASLTCFRINLICIGSRNHFRSSRSIRSSICHRWTSTTRSKDFQLNCANNFSLDVPLPYGSPGESQSIISGSDVIEPIYAQEMPDLPIFQSEQDVELRSEPFVTLASLKWPMWFLGPSVLLATGMVPTLWLPLSSVFLGPNIAGLLSLVGLDCIFNLGAMLFLLMADASGRPKEGNSVLSTEIPLSYKFWNIVACIFGILVPVALSIASSQGTLLQPHIPAVSTMVLLGPYLLLLSIQVLAEMLTWHWKSPAWLTVPVVYESYRVLQLMRGLTLANEISAPVWMVQTLRILVCWWILVLGIQLMRVAWFAGFTSRKQDSDGKQLHG